MIVFIHLSCSLFPSSVEADKDLTQSLVYEASEEKFSVAQTTCEISDESVIIAPSSEQKAPALPSEESVTVQSAAITVSSELMQPTAIESAKSTDKKLSETSIEQSSQESTPQSKSESLPVETQQTDSEPSTCLLADAACKKEVITPITQIESATTPTETKLETPVSAIQDATELTTTLISVDSLQSITASSVTSEASLKETAKDVIESDVMQPLTIDPSEQHADVLLAASEISTVSPVPIQVAESVLQAEPKESVLDATAADQAIATTVTAVHESVDIASASIAVEPVQLNGSVCEKRDNIATVIADLSKSSDISIQKTEKSASDLVITKDASSEAPSAIIEKVESVSSVVFPETSSAKVEKLTEQIVKIETTEPEQAKEAEITEAAAKSPSEIPETSEIVEPSSVEEESAEATVVNIPSTPTVIEATPPTSPSVESTQEVEEKQAGKKSLKKSDSADVDGGGADGESADKKGAKKTVKKVTKKPKTKSEEATPSTTADGATAGDGSQSKVKKTVKVTKKVGAKTGQTLETDTSVPETPPPPSSPPAAATSDVPVPPKRKTKSTNAKGTTGKKPEAEE